MKRKIEFIYWFAYYNFDSPSVRYRARYPLDYFGRKFNVGSYLVVPGYTLKKIAYFLKVYFSVLLFRRKNSLIVIQRVQSNFIYATLLKFLVRVRRQNTVYDLDDADYLEVNPETIFYFVKYCQLVSAGSRQIETYLSRFSNHIVHTTSPIVDLEIVKKSRNSIFTIGWIGGFGGEHKKSVIDFVFPAIKALNFPLKLIVMGVQNSEDIDFIENYFCTNLKVEVEIPLNIDWNDEAAIQHKIVAFDIGIATLTNSELQLSKSGIKAKQYLNNGVPVLSTNLPENNSVVVEGVNGYFCTTVNDFRDKFILFRNMADTDYLRFVENARKSVANFDHNKYFHDFEKMISSNDRN
ncbi:MAG: glycosyltransferase [Bacteroidetes bacterium]|nr:glycosyltransferase [Bacteroidota bacterium]